MYCLDAADPAGLLQLLHPNWKSADADHYAARIDTASVGMVMLAEMMWVTVLENAFLPFAVRTGTSTVKVVEIRFFDKIAEQIVE